MHFGPTLVYCLLLLVSQCGNQVSATCNIEALRCDVICFFPELTNHCNSCGIRRPMRFGKRFSSVNGEANKGNQDLATDEFVSGPGKNGNEEVAIPAQMKRIFNTNPIQSYFNKFLTANPRKELVNPPWLIADLSSKDLVSKLYKMAKISKFKRQQFKRNMSMLTSKDLSTEQLVSGIKGVIQLQNLPLDPISYGCHDLM